MIGFTFAPHPRKNTGRENLDDIVIERKLPAPISGDSWWTKHGPDGWTRFCETLFERRRPRSTDATFEGPKRRASDFDSQ